MLQRIHNRRLFLLCIKDMGKTWGRFFCLAQAVNPCYSDYEIKLSGGAKPYVKNRL